MWETSHILHRDISYGNIMFYREDDGSVVGVLTDWDMAEEWDGEEEVVMTIEEMQAQVERARAVVSGKISPTELDAPIKPESKTVADVLPNNGQEGVAALSRKNTKACQKTRCRTGTGPFMAVDLLQPGTAPRHVYLHDLESFFWVLAWFCAVFDPKKRRLRGLSLWDQASLEDIGSAKERFLTDGTTFKRTFAKTDSAYRPLVDTWIEEIRCEVRLAFRTSQMESQAIEEFIRIQNKPRISARNLVHLKFALESVTMARRQADELLSFDIMMELLDLPAV